MILQLGPWRNYTSIYTKQCQRRSFSITNFAITLLHLWFSIVNHDKSGNTYCRWTYWNVVNDAATCTIKKLYMNTHWTMSRRSFSNINFAITLLHLWFSILNHNKPGDTYFRWTYLNAVDDTYCNLDHEEIIHQYTNFVITLLYLWFSILNHVKPGDTYCRRTYWNAIDGTATWTMEKLYINIHWTVSRKLNYVNLRFLSCLWCW